MVLVLMLLLAKLRSDLVCLQILQSDSKLEWLAQVEVARALASQDFLALEEVLGVVVKYLLLKYHFGEVKGNHVEQSVDHSFQQIVQFKIVEPLLDDEVGLDEGPSYQVVPELVLIVAVYLPDVEFQKVCLILELAWIELFVYEVYDHLSVGVVHVVVDDQLHSFDGHALIAIER